MKFFFRNEFDGIYLFLKRNKDEAVIISFAMLFVVLHSYNTLWNDWFSSLVYYALLPVLTIVVLLRRNPLDFGLKWGDFKIWGYYVAIVCLIAAPILFAVSLTPPFQKYYHIEKFNLLNYSLVNCASLFALEYFFRGFLLFGLRSKLKEGSIFVQMIPFVLIHVGKPEIETLSTILTGILFGYIAYRGKSFWPAFLIHIFINIFFVLSVNLV